MGDGCVRRRLAAALIVVVAGLVATSCRVAHTMVESDDALAGEPVVALTFDDGPSPTTNDILDVLARFDVTATFFIVGTQAERYPWIVARIAMEGHHIANHTWSHASLTSMSDAQIISDITRLNDWLGGYGLMTKCVRPPYGDRNKRVDDAIFSTGTAYSMLWSIDTNDWKGHSPSQITDTVMGGLEPGSVVLMHDGPGRRPNTVAALEQMIPRIREAGFGIRAAC